MEKWVVEKRPVNRLWMDSVWSVLWEIGTITGRADRVGTSAALLARATRITQ